MLDALFVAQPILSKHCSILTEVINNKKLKIKQKSTAYKTAEPEARKNTDRE